MEYEKEKIIPTPDLVPATDKFQKSNILSFAELIQKEFPPVPWDVEGLFESGTINMISAPPNQYKSWLVQHIALCLAQGAKVFGQFEVRQQNVLIVNEEDNLRMMKERSIQLIDTTGNFGVYFMVGSGFKVSGISISKLLGEMDDRKVTFVIFDSLRSVHDANENDSQEMQGVLDEMKLLTRLGVTVLFTHHHRKKALGFKSNDNSGEESRGSTAINASVHGHISCEEVFKDDGKYLVISQRKLKCAEKMKPFLLKIDNDIENNKMRFTYQGAYDEKAEEMRKQTEMTLRFVNESNVWISKRDISVGIKRTESSVSKVLQELERSGMIQSKTKKELDKMNIQTNYPEAKHNAKFYFRQEEKLPENTLLAIQADDDF